MGHWALLDSLNHSSTISTPIRPIVSPPARSSYVHFFNSYSRSFYVFGGATSIESLKSLLNDMWKYDLKTAKWIQLNNDHVSLLGFTMGKGKSNRKNLPSARKSSTFYYDHYTKLLYMFGGYGYETQNNELQESTGSSEVGYLSDLWVYSAQTSRWTWLDGKLDLNRVGIITEEHVYPGARLGSSFFYSTYTYSLYMFGGFGYPGRYSDEVNPDNQDAGFLNDFYRFDIDKEQWQFLAGETEINNQGAHGHRHQMGPSYYPSARFGHASFYDFVNKTAYIVAGRGIGLYGSNGYLNDVWKFDLDKNQWGFWGGSREVNQKTRNFNLNNQLNWKDNWEDNAGLEMSPGGRFGFMSVVSLDNAYMYLYGGYGLDIYGRETYLNELWQYRYDLDSWNLVSGSGTGNTEAVYPSKLNEASFSVYPSARSDFGGWFDHDKDIIYVYGGEGVKGPKSLDVLGDLWRLDMYRVELETVLTQFQAPVETKVIPIPPPKSVPPTEESSISQTHYEGNQSVSTGSDSRYGWTVLLLLLLVDILIVLFTYAIARVLYLRKFSSTSSKGVLLK
ncbi:hypothetical protein MP638_005840 [Amoeboaphelidium occidentale]|nr:hypothetical protein MP638_005840 [Amoeboaphelidium occidentale]